MNNKITSSHEGHIQKKSSKRIKRNEVSSFVKILSGVVKLPEDFKDKEAMASAVALKSWIGKAEAEITIDLQEAKSRRAMQKKKLKKNTR